MATINQLFGTTAQSITLTLTSITNSSLQQSTAVDNTSNLFMDVKVAVRIKTASASTSATGAVNVFAYGTADTTTPVYSGGASGTNGSYTANKDNLIYLGSIAAVANSTTYDGLFNLSRAFGYGGIPAKWGIVVENLSGATLDASVGSAWYQGINATVA